MRISRNGTLSDSFLLLMVLSRVVFLALPFVPIYIDGMLVKLSQANLGCHAGEFFVEALAY